MNKKLILIGPKTGIKGGGSVSFNHLLDELDRRNVEYTCIDMPGGNYSFKRFFLIAVYLFRIAKSIKRNCVISLHASDNSAIVYTIFLDVIARLTGSKLIIRVFGGQHLNIIKQKNSFIKKRILACYRRHRLLLQTKKMVENAASEYGLMNVRWFPTSRPAATPKNSKSFQPGPLKLLYISQVRRNKGIDRVIKLAGSLSENKLNAEISVYGEVFDEAYILEINSLPDQVIQYKGVAKSEEVYDVMRESDLMLFPTRYVGEGYPGVIVEAINVMLPVMATDMVSIRDLIDHEKDGLLVDFEDEELVLKKVKDLIEDREMLIVLHKHLEQKRNQFSSEFWNGEFFLSLVEGDKKREPQRAQRTPRNKFGTGKNTSNEEVV